MSIKNKSKDELFLEMMQWTSRTQNLNRYTDEDINITSRFQKIKPYVEARFCHSLIGWQKNTVDLLKSGKDVYVVARPSAGKTMPMFCYWLNEHAHLNTDRIFNNNIQQPIPTIITNLNNLLFDSKNIKKLVIFVPVVTLAQTTRRDFIEDFSSLIIQFLDIFIGGMIIETRFNNTQLNRLAENLIRRFDRYVREDLLSLYRRMIDIANHIDNLNSQISNSINIRRNIITNKLKEAEDEFNRMFKQVKSVIRDAIFNICDRDLIFMYTGQITKGNNINKAPIVIATYQTSNMIFSNLNMNNIGMVVFDEAHLSQKFRNEEKQKPKGNSSDFSNNMTQTEQISSSIYSTLNIIKNDTRILFLSGTINPSSAHMISKLLSKCFNRKLKVLDKIPERNPAILNYIPANWLRQDEEIIRRLLISPQTTNNLIVIFSKNRILKMIDRVIKLTNNAGTSLAAIDQGANKKFKFSNLNKTNILDDRTLNKSERRYLANRSILTNFPELTDDDLKLINQIPGAQNILHPIQQKAVTMGIGFIFRMDKNVPFVREDMMERYYNDFEIIADLFKKGIIKTILATSAIGIGVNMTVQNLFITSTEKPGPSKIETIDLAELSQIINRSGRAAFKIANVYAPEEDIPLIQKAISANVTDFEERINISNFDLNKACTREMFKSIFRMVSS